MEMDNCSAVYAIRPSNDLRWLPVSTLHQCTATAKNADDPIQKNIYIEMDSRKMSENQLNGVDTTTKITK